MKKIFIAFFLFLSAFSLSENVIRKISVTGISERDVMPDTAKISFQIDVKNENLNTAAKELRQKIDKFKAGLKSKKINSADFETVSFYNRKQKDYGNNDNDYYYVEDVQKDFKGKKTTSATDTKKKKPASYTVQMTVIIRNTDFGKISDLIEFSDKNRVNKIKKVDNEPDAYYFTLSETETTSEKALNKISDKFRSVKAKLLSSGISENNIIFNNYKVTENTEGKIKNEKDVFIVTEIFTVTTKNLKNLNDIISLADENSININGTISFDISNKEQLAAEMYNEAFDQAKSKALSILKSSGMSLSSPLVVSEDRGFQQKMLNRIDEEWVVPAPAAEFSAKERAVAVSNSARVSSYSSPKVDYTPKPIKLFQNISVMYEIK